MAEERLVAGLRCGDVLARLSEYLDGDLAASEAARVEEHLRACDWCERFGGDFATAVQALRNAL